MQAGNGNAAARPQASRLRFSRAAHASAALGAAAGSPPPAAPPRPGADPGARGRAAAGSGGGPRMTAGRHIRGNSQDWGTPPLYVDAVRKMLGRIDLDPCSNRHSVVNAAVEYMPPEKDGLKESWDYPSIYVNPPYGISSGRYKGRIGDWLARCADAHEQHGAEVVALVPVATNTSHWKTSVFGRAAALCFLYDTRLKFLVNGREGGTGAPMSCAMVYWGRRFGRFLDVFLRYGAVTNISHLRGLEIGAHHAAAKAPPRSTEPEGGDGGGGRGRRAAGRPARRAGPRQKARAA